jgi:hypothetical protein
VLARGPVGAVSPTAAPTLKALAPNTRECQPEAFYPCPLRAAQGVEVSAGPRATRWVRARRGRADNPTEVCACCGTLEAIWGPLASARPAAAAAHSTGRWYSDDPRAGAAGDPGRPVEHLTSGLTSGSCGSNGQSAGTNSMLSKRSYARISLCRTPRCLPSFNGI